MMSESDEIKRPRGDRYVTDEELRAIVAQIDDEQIRIFVQVVAMCGQHPLTVRELKQRDIDAEFVRFAARKKRNAVTIRLSIPLAALLSRAKELASGSVYVFTDANGGPISKRRIGRHFKQARDRTGVECLLRDLQARAIVSTCRVSGRMDAR